MAGNTAARGGGIDGSGSDVLLIDNSTLVDNIASIEGGGYYAVVGRMTRTNSTLAGKAANFSGGLFNSSGGTARLRNSTVAENTASDAGGGIYFPNAGFVRLQNTLMARNFAENRGSDCFYIVCGTCAGRIESLGNNLIGNTTDCNIPLLSSDIVGDPGIGDFTDDDTPGRGHFPLLVLSQAIDAGNDAVCTDTDQLGQPRVGPCDIGSIEFQGSSLVAAVNSESSIDGRSPFSASFERLIATGEVERVVQALVEANRRIADPKNSEEVIEEIIGVFGFDRASAEQFYGRLVASLTLNGTVEMDKIKLAIEIARSSLE